MRIRRLSIIGLLSALPLAAAGCSGVIGDGFEELSYDSTKTSSTGSPNTGTGQNQPAGSSGGVSGSPLPASYSANGASMTIAKFDVNSTSIVDGQGLNVHWTVDYATPAAGYVAEFHLSDSPSRISSQTQLFSRNGDNSPLAAGRDATVSCVWQVNGTATSLSCPGYSNGAHTVTSIAPLYGVLRACTFGSLMESVCTQSAVQFSTAAPTSGGSTATPVTATGTGAYLTIDRFDVTPASIGNDQSVTVSWGLRLKTPATSYTAEFHLSNGQQVTPGFSGFTRIFADNGVIAASETHTDVSRTATVGCMRQTDQTGPVMNCGSSWVTNILADLTQPVYGILKACVFDADGRQVCAEKPVPLTFP